MIEALARFVDALRAEGQSVSPAEVLDASHALDLVELSRRADVKAALRATLAKDHESLGRFDRVFDTFFAVPAWRSKGEGERSTGSSGRRPNPVAARGQQPFSKRGHSPFSSTVFGSPKLDKKKGSVPFLKRRGRQLLVKRERSPFASTASPSPSLDEKRGSVPFSKAGDPIHRTLAERMTTEEEREIARQVPRMVQALKLRAGRREASAAAGRPWLRRTLRDNLRHGGVPFVIPYRAPKRKTTRVVLLTDVSYSVAAASGFFLLLAAEFLELGRRARVLAFVDRPVDATTAVRRWARGAFRAEPVPAASPQPRRGRKPGAGIVRRSISFADLLDRLPGLSLEAPSDYGTALHALRGSRLRPRGRDTVLVVLGDGRTNRFDPLSFALDELARGCKAVIWIVPEPRSRWGTADSALPVYAASVDVLVEAHDLAGLARGLAELLRKL